MGILEQILAQVDNAKRVAGRNAKDFISNPADFLSMVTGRVNETSEKIRKGDMNETLNIVNPTGLGGGILGATVFHGTPYKFAPTTKNALGEFLDKHIGSGVGRQVYGHGHYVAEAKDVAKEYAKMGNRQEILVRASALERSLTNPRLAAEQAELIRQQVFDLREKAKNMPEGGVVYKIDLPDEAIAKMLDWDKPINKQHPEVLKGLKQSGIAGPKHLWDLDESAVSDFVRGLHPADQLEMFTKGGIPGIKYLDQASIPAGEGTRNYVVADPTLLKILGIEE